MKGLSIKQPWASLIAHGIKDIENRTWRTNFRGKIYIHASGKLAKAQTGHCLLTGEQFEKLKITNEAELIKFLDNDYVTVAIIGEVEIIDCVINHPSIWAEKTAEIGKTIEGEPLYKEKPIWNWVLANAKLYEKPILNVKGKLSFWEPDISIKNCTCCEDGFNTDEMKHNDGEFYFCDECWENLTPLMAK